MCEEVEGIMSFFNYFKIEGKLFFMLEKYFFINYC